MEENNEDAFYMGRLNITKIYGHRDGINDFWKSASRNVFIDHL